MAHSIISIIHAGYANDCYAAFELAWELNSSPDTASRLMVAMGPNALGIKTDKPDQLDFVGEQYGKSFVSDFIYSDPVLKKAFKEWRNKTGGCTCVLAMILLLLAVGGAIYGYLHH